MRQWMRRTLSRRFGYLALTGLAAMLILAVLGLGYSLSASPAEIHAENGPIEQISLVAWLASALIGAFAFKRHSGPHDRPVFFWLGTLGLLAALREVDAQVVLNPAYLGQFGVRYRLDWFLSPQVSLPLRVAWLVLFATVALLLIIPVVRMRRSAGHLLREGDAAAGLFIISVLCLAFAYAFDDLFRDTHLLVKAIRKAIEEISELLGSLAFLACLFSLLWKPPSERIAAFKARRPQLDTGPWRR